VLPDDTGSSAVWAARRVPDDHITVLANMFTIEEIEIYNEVGCLKINIILLVSCNSAGLHYVIEYF
jgi:hypothetical protein